MKSIKFLLAALVVSAMFASCAKEEMVVAPETQSGEFVGAKLLGSNLAVNFTAGDPSTKVTNGAWDASDRLGLGWVVNGTFGAEQDSLVLPSTGALYANHLYQLSGNVLTSKGNIYEGWHFGYYPFQYQEHVGKALKAFVVNPTQTTATSTDERKTTSLHLSPVRFLGDGSLNENYELAEGASFPMFNIVKTINVNVKPSDSLKNDATLKNVKIAGITIKSAGKNIFPTEYDENAANSGIIVNPLGLDTLQTIKQYTTDSIMKRFYQVLNAGGVQEVHAATPANSPVYAVSSTMTDEISVDVDCSTITLGADQTLRVNTLPIVQTLDTSNFVISIATSVGTFDVSYPGYSTANAVQKLNKDALAKLAAAYKKADGNDRTKDGALSAWNLNASGKYRPGIGIDLVITPSMFTPDFKIAKVEQWNEAVTFVNALGLKEAEFKLTDNIKFTSNIVLPESAKLTVSSAASKKIVLDGATAWAGQTATNNKFVVNVPVEVAKDITVNGLMRATKVTNKAVISAGATAVIEDLDNTKTNGTNTKVVAEFGATVKPLSGDFDSAYLGVVEYVVNDATKETISKINTLIDPSNNQNSIKVNTLVVKTALSLHAEATPTISGGYGQNTSNYLADLSNVDVILDGGSLTGYVSTTPVAVNKVNVKSVVAKSGTTAITNVVIASNTLDVLAGTMTATDVQFDANDEVTVAEGAELIIAQSANANKYNDLQSIDVAGTAKVNINGLTVTDVNVDGTLTIGETSHVIYKGTPQVSGTVTGIFKTGVEGSALQDAIDDAVDGQTIYVISDITGTIEVEKNITINMNGRTLTSNGDGFVSKASGKTLTITGHGTVNASQNQPNSSMCAVWAVDGGKVVIENGTFSVGKADNNGTQDCIYASAKGQITINGGTFTNEGTYVAADGGVLINVKQIAPDTDSTKWGKITVNAGTFTPAAGCPKWEADDVAKGRVVLAEGVK